MTSRAEDQRFSPHGCHNLLPERFPLSHIGQFPHMVDFEGSLVSAAVLAPLRTEPLDDFRAAQREDAGVWREVYRPPARR